MASRFSNAFTIALFALLTFLVIDVSKHDSFEKTVTAKYLNTIGVTPYVVSSIKAIKKSSIYKQYLLPYGNDLSRTVQNFLSAVKLTTIKYIDKISFRIKKNFASFLEYFEQTIIPVLEENWLRFYSEFRQYWNTISLKTSEIATVSGDWLNKNMMNFPREKVIKIMNEFVTSTQKLASRSFDYLTSQVQKIMTF